MGLFLLTIFSFDDKIFLLHIASDLFYMEHCVWRLGEENLDSVIFLREVLGFVLSDSLITGDSSLSYGGIASASFFFFFQQFTVVVYFCFAPSRL